MAPDLYDRLSAEIDKIRLVDTHEHLEPEPDRLAKKVDFFRWFLHYASADLVSSGMSLPDLETIRNPDKPLDERWSLFAPHWENMKNTSYARALLITARDLFGVDQINRKTAAQLSEQLAAANKPGFYRWVLQEKAGIDCCIWDGLAKISNEAVEVPEGVDRNFFVPVMRFEHYILVRNRLALAKIEAESNRAIHSLDDLLSAADDRMERALKAGAVGIKIGLAYLRSLKFDKTTHADAERVFNRIFTFPDPRPDWQDWQILSGPAGDEAKPLQDFILHHVMRRADQKGLPVQIHTGLQEGNGNLITNSDPTLLVNLFFEYRNVKFDIFHGSYPYCSELATLAKNFPNVYVDMCWLHVLSPAVSRRALNEWIETVPANKIFAFGGDYVFVEGVYGHSRMARENVARILAHKIQEGYLSEDDALSLAQKMLHDNPYELYRLADRPKQP